MGEHLTDDMVPFGQAATTSDMEVRLPLVGWSLVGPVGLVGEAAHHASGVPDKWESAEPITIGDNVWLKATREGDRERREAPQSRRPMCRRGGPQNRANLHGFRPRGRTQRASKT